MVDIPLLDPQPCIKVFLFFPMVIIYIALTFELIRFILSAERPESMGMSSADWPEGGPKDKRTVLVRGLASSFTGL